MKIAINTCWGGFSLNLYGLNKLNLGDKRLENKDFEINSTNPHAYRADPRLIQLIETEGAKVFGTYARIKIIIIPDDVSWEIDNYDGVETVHETHRTWI